MQSFTKWAKRSTNSTSRTGDKTAVVYTRVSSKEQFDTNLSLDWQRKTIDEYASRCGFQVQEYFGGVYESAKTDGRVEFKRMLDYVKRNKKVTHILVYLLDRFSRTGGGAIKLAKELREKYGITIIAVTQPIDTSNPGGVFQQNIQFLFGEYDNQLRRQRAMAGMKEKFQRGIWCLTPPMGYSIVYTNGSNTDEKRKGDRKIVINETGRKLRKAFEWKAKGMKNEEILERLNKAGVKIYKQKLSMIFSNPFYCGIISTKMLNGELVEGTHEKLISQSLFLQVNQVRSEAKGKYGILHTKEQEQVPLKVFMKCSCCNQGYTGYIVKARNIWYYKCRTVGCGNNKNAIALNNEFSGYLSNFAIKEHLIAPFLYTMKQQFKGLDETRKEEQKNLKAELAELQKKMDTLEEDYYINKSVPAETYQKFMEKFVETRTKILQSAEACNTSSSNIYEHFEYAVNLSAKLATVWTSSDVNTKEKLQKMVFPDGIVYDRKNGEFRTEKVNEVFRLIARLNSVSGENKTGQTNNEVDLSSEVGLTLFRTNKRSPFQDN
jgi:DNA invertase Pin-like site-specific DNA recombinase